MVSMKYVLGFTVGVILGLILVAVVFTLSHKGKPGKCVIDERQRLVRGTGFKYAFFILMIYDVLYFILAVFFPDSVIVAPVAIFLGLCLSIAIFAIYCIWNDGYYAINENQKALIIGFLSLALLNFIGFLRGVLEKQVIVNGKIGFPIINLAAATTLLVIVATTIIKSKRRNQDEEDRS